MCTLKRGVSALLISLLFSTVVSAFVRAEVFAQEEMMPQWGIENGGEFTKVAVSADGEHIAAVANNTNMLYVFQSKETLWNASIDSVYSLAMSADGRYVAVGAKSNFYLFNAVNSTPQLKYQLAHESSLVAVSADGGVSAVGTSSPIGTSNAGTVLYLFERERHAPVWNNPVPGVLESLSMSDDGNYIAVSTSSPGVLYLFTKERMTPLWSYDFGERGGGAKISGNGDYIVAVGGNQTGGKSMRVYRFLRQGSTPNYIKVISELPSYQGLSVSANGSIFAISYAESNYLVFFNLELPPYGYGPGSVLNVSLPSSRVSMSMSSDGRHVIVGTARGVFVYEYLNRLVNLRKRYVVDEPFINDIAASSDGRFIIAAATVRLQNSKRSVIYIFDNFDESQVSFVGSWLEFGLAIVAVVVILAVELFFLRKKYREPSGRHG